jgi:glycosyltransferase involved in cell wall biosynthesis
LRAELERAGFTRLCVVTRGVDTHLFSPQRRNDALRQTWGAPGETPVALFVGRIAPEKNLGALAGAFQAMRQVAPQARLVIVGDGPARRDLQELVPEAIFAGTRSGEDLAAHYASADAFVFPSMTETFGNVTTEAMASGLPVVAYRHAAAGQLIRSGENGLLASLGDQGLFQERAAFLFRERARATEMGAAARRAACELSWDRVIAQVESVFLAAVRSGSASMLAESLGAELPADARAA